MDNGKTTAATVGRPDEGRALSHDERARALAKAARLALDGDPEAGESIIQTAWPHLAKPRLRRSATDEQKLQVWLADGFRCRYTGELLFLPQFLRAVGLLWPRTVPWQRNGKAQHTHEANWTHMASLEHVEPNSVGGAESEENWITTSMGRNQVRSRYPLEHLGWRILPREPLADWDGGCQAFVGLVERYPQILTDSGSNDLARWAELVRASLRPPGPKTSPGPRKNSERSVEPIRRQHRGRFGQPTWDKVEAVRQRMPEITLYMSDKELAAKLWRNWGPSDALARTAIHWQAWTGEPLPDHYKRYLTFKNDTPLD